jgi:PGF-CTERM protein
VVRVEADSTDQLEEADETNNDWEQQTITVSEETPGMGAALAVMAALGAGALVRRRR